MENLNQNINPEQLPETGPVPEDTTVSESGISAEAEAVSEETAADEPNAAEAEADCAGDTETAAEDDGEAKSEGEEDQIMAWSFLHGKKMPVHQIEHPKTVRGKVLGIVIEIIIFAALAVTVLTIRDPIMRIANLF